MREVGDQAPTRGLTVLFRRGNDSIRIAQPEEDAHQPAKAKSKTRNPQGRVKRWANLNQSTKHMILPWTASSRSKKNALVGASTNGKSTSLPAGSRKAAKGPKELMFERFSKQRTVKGLKTLHDTVPRNREGTPQLRSNLDGGGILSRFYQLHISTADVCLFSKLLLREGSRLSQSVYILSKDATFELAHIWILIKNTLITAKHASLLDHFHPCTTS